MLLGADARAASDSATRKMVGLQGSGFLAEISAYLLLVPGTADVIYVNQLLEKKGSREM